MTKIDDFISGLDALIAQDEVDSTNIYNVLIRKAVALAASGQLGGGAGGTSISEAEVLSAILDALPAQINGRIPVDVEALTVSVDNASLEIANDVGNPIPVNYPELLTRLGTNGDAASATGSEAAQLRQLADYLLGVTNKFPNSIGSQIPVTLKDFSYSFATATNATTTVTIPAPGQGLKNIIKEIHFSTAGGGLPAAGVPLSITANSNTYSLDVTNTGPGTIQFNVAGASNGAVVVTLGAGGAGVVGKLLVGYQVV